MHLGHEPERMKNIALVDEVERFAHTERERLAALGIETRFSRGPDLWDPANIVLKRLPAAEVDLMVWPTGEAELGAAWGNPLDGWNRMPFEHLDLMSVDDVRRTLDRLVVLVRADAPPGPQVTSRDAD